MPENRRYHEYRSSNVHISLIQCREYVVRRDGKNSLHTTAVLPGKRSKWFLRYKTASRGKRKWSVPEWTECVPPKPAQTGALWAALCRASLSRSLCAAELILVNYRQCHKQRVSSSGSLQSVFCVLVTRLKEIRRKEQPWVLSIFKWGFRGIGNTIQENKINQKNQHTLPPSYLNFLYHTVYCQIHILHRGGTSGKKKKSFFFGLAWVP